MTSAMTELRAQLALAGPVIVVNLAMMGMGVVDTLMAGHVSTTAQAAIGLGHAWVWCPVSFALGLLMALDPLVAQARGAGDGEGVARSVQRGLILAALVSIPVAATLLLAETVFSWLPSVGLNLDPELVQPASGYSTVSALGVPAMLGWLTLRQTLQAMGKLRAIVIVAVLANGVNVLGNGALMNGWWGLPALGAVGCAWSTVIVEWVMVLALLVVAWPLLGSLLWPLRERAASPAPLWRVMKLGFPIGVAIALETGAFNGVQFLMSDFGATVMAGHRTAIVIASTSFMVPLGLSMAASVRVGHAVGAGDPDGARQAARVAIWSGGVVMAGFGLLFLTLPGPLARAFSSDPAAVAVTLSLLPIAAAFQLFDGLQVVAAGVLRGTADTTWPSVLNFVGYWVLALPIGAYLAFEHGFGAKALWWGLAGGLALVAILLLVRVGHRLSGDVARFDAEGLGESGQ
jgi:MATE family multidrug resistance protein